MDGAAAAVGRGGGRAHGLHALTSVSCPAAAGRRSFSLTYASAHAQRPPSLFLGGRVGLVESRTWKPCACDSSDIDDNDDDGE